METNLENKSIEIGEETLKHFNTTRKWAMFLAILGFIFIGLMLLIGVLAGTFLSAFNSGAGSSGIPSYLILIIILLMAAVYFFPVLYLFRFSKHTAHAIQNLDNVEFAKAIKNLKAYFVYLGILLIVVLSFYFIALIVAGTSMAFLKGLG